MENPVISYISYGLALLVGGICYLLVKHTADEFDRWYEQPRFRTARIAVGSIAAVALALGYLLLR